MLLPIGSDQTTVRRMPWVSLSIIALCVIVYLILLVAPGDERAVTEAELRAVEYFLEHPYLELDPRVKGHLYYALRQAAGEGPGPPADRRQLETEQRQLDSLVVSFVETRDRLPFWRWGVVPADVEPAALITYTFVHAGLLHLLGNLFFFYLVGPAVEDVWGRPLFLGFYVVAGVVAALVFIARYPDLAEPLIGASGAVAGVMGAFAVRYWNSRITFFYFIWFIRIYQGTFTAPAGLMLGLWALGELAFAMGLWAFFSLADLGDVGFLAHVGGFIFGVAFAGLVAKLRVEQRWVDPAVERGLTVHDSSAVEELLAVERGGQTEEAIRGLEAILARDPGDADAAAALWSAAVRAGDPSRALAWVLPAIEEAVRTHEPGLLAQLWPEILTRTPEVDVDVRMATRIAELLGRQGLDGDVELTLSWLAGRVDSSTPEALLVRLARLAHELSMPAPFAELALRNPDLSPELEEQLQRLSGCSA